jgi:hypothetical protein
MLQRLYCIVPEAILFLGENNSYLSLPLRLSQGRGWAKADQNVFLLTPSLSRGGELIFKNIPKPTLLSFKL